MASHPKLVNKQFNSPIGLYSDQNVREVIERESHILANGAVGINFHNSNVGKPANLQNSAVLRMLEEEEHRQRNGQIPSNGYSPKPLRDEIKWPPPDYEHKNILKSTFKDVVTPGLKRVAWPPPGEGEDFVEQPAVQAQGGPPYSSQNNNHSPAQQHRYPLKPLDISGTSSPSYQSSSFSPLTNPSPAGFRSPTPGKQWAPVHSPVATPNQPQFKPSTQQYQSPPQQYQSAPQQYQSTPQQYQSTPQQYQSAPQQYQSTPQQYQSAPQQYQSAPQQYQPPSQQYNSAPQYQPTHPQNQFVPQQQPTQAPANVGAAQNQVQSQQRWQQNSPAAKKVEPPATTITLRPQAPVSQAPPPVVNSQPATATLKGGKHLRGDLKWPPEHVKKQFEEEKKHLLELSKGPACRPLAVRKDYTPFFQQHALNSSYPGYKVPPGTQFYDHCA